MKLQVINIDGKKTENIELSDKIFSVKPNKNLIQSIVEWQLNHFKPRAVAGGNAAGPRPPPPGPDGRLGAPCPAAPS